MGRQSLTCWLAVWLGIITSGVQAHEFEPALLSLRETAPEAYDVLLRVPSRMAKGQLTPIFPQATLRVGGESRARYDDAVVTRFRIRVPGGIAGQPLAIGGALGPVDEVLLRIESAAGVVMGRLRADGPQFVVPRAPSALMVARSYLGLGLEHIATGLDHLLFVFALILLAPSLRVVLGTVTAFTLAHSATLALSALGFWNAPAPPLEALIALSIVFAARELWQRRGAERPYRTGRLWLVAFGFGLLHGLGFAGALGEIGLPAGDTPLALLSFNAGVELGQLAFVAVVLVMARLVPAKLSGKLAALRLPAYGIGSIATCFFIERVVAIFAR
jgi:hypothetical protein